MTPRALISWVLSVCAAFVFGLVLGWSAPLEKAGKIEAPRPAVVHGSGAVSLARVVEPPPPALDMAPGTEARTRAVVLELEPLPGPRKVQLDFQEGADGTRVTVKGEGVQGGSDFVIAPRRVVDAGPWRLGAAWTGRNAGPAVAYEWKRVTIGGAATREGGIVWGLWRW